MRLALKIALVTLASLFALELLLFFADRLGLGRSFWVYDSDLGFKVRSHLAWGNGRTNAFGFNDRDYPLERTSGTRRLLVLGDSFNWTGGLNDNHVAMLQRRFDAALGPGALEAINAGYPGTHTAEQLALLKKYGLRYHPDLVVLGFYVGNDYLDADPGRRRTVFAGELRDLEPASEAACSPGQLLVSHSRILCRLTRILNGRHRATGVERAAPRLAVPEAGNEKPYAEHHLALEYAHLAIADPRQALALQPNVEYIHAALHEMATLLAAQGIQFLVVAYPDSFQVDERLRQALAQRYSLDMSSYQWNRPQELLAACCAAEGIKFHDLLPLFEQAQRAGERLYPRNDPHWSRHGSERAASFLCDLLLPRVSSSAGDQAAAALSPTTRSASR